jgi:hypothetical protein
MISLTLSFILLADPSLPGSTKVAIGRGKYDTQLQNDVSLVQKRTAKYLSLTLTHKKKGFRKGAWMLHGFFSPTTQPHQSPSVFAPFGPMAKYAGPPKLESGEALLARETSRRNLKFTFTQTDGKIVLNIPLPEHGSELILLDLIGSEKPLKAKKGHTVDWNALPYVNLVRPLQGALVIEQFPTKLP